MMKIKNEKRDNLHMMPSEFLRVASDEDDED